jgi:putative transposase
VKNLLECSFYDRKNEMECKDFEPSIIQDDDILKTFNTTDTWLDVETVAALKKISNRAVRLSLKKKNPDGTNKYNYHTENVRGGSAYKIKLASLEEEYQIKYIKEYYDNLTVVDNKIELHNFQPKSEKIISEFQRKKALAKYDLIKFWEEYRKNKKENNIPNKSSDKMFVESYNTGLLYPEIFAVLNTTGIGSLYSWKNIIDKNPDWTALVGNYKYSSNKVYRTKLKEEEITVFLKILLSPNRFSIGKAIGLTIHILEEKGFENIPKPVTFRRYAKWYKTANYDKWVLAREGAKALKDRVEPYIVRDTSVLEPGQVLIADGHTLNFQVLNPFTGKPCRATLIGFLDWKSGGLVGYDIMLEECTQSICSALRNAILNMDHIPNFVYQDNGRAFKSKFFNGDTKGLVGGVKQARISKADDFSPLPPIRFEELGFTGIYEKLGIKPVYATPYNARAKVIERFFLDFQESFEKLIPSYIGTSIENKPAYMKRNEKLHQQLHHNFTPTMEQALSLVREWLKFKHSQPCPNMPNKTIQEVLDSIPKQNICEEKLDDLMMAQEVKHIGRNGIRFLKADYFNDELYGIREKAIIKYNLSDLSYIKVYSVKGEFLCRAERVTATHPLAYQMGDIKDIEDYKQKIKKQNQLRNKTMKAVKAHFALEDIELIKTNLIENTLVDNNSVIKADILKPEKIKKEKPTETFVNNRPRPLFKDNYERYEWHMKNGCTSTDDRRWFEEYIKSEEYKNIYGEMSEWDKNEVFESPSE